MSIPDSVVAAEQAVLGGLLLDSSARSRINGLAAEHFSRIDHGLIFDAISDEFDEIGRADTVSVFERLQRAGSATDIGGLPYLNSLAQNTPSAANVARYAQIVERAWQERQTQALLAEAEEAVARGDLTVVREIGSKLLRLGADHGAASLRMRIECVPVAELLAQPRAEDRVKGLFPMKGTASIVGASGSGKTFLAIDLAGAITREVPFFDHRTRRCGVVILAAEGEHGTADRIRAYLKHNGLTELPIEVIPCAVDLLGGGGELDATISAISNAETRIGPVHVLLVDTVNRTMPGGDENSSEDMSRYLGNVDRLRRAIDGLVILNHHLGKDATRGPRGHSSFYAAMDSVVEVTREGDRRSLKVTKCRDGADGEEHSFRLLSVQVGIDADGDPVTSCVIEPADSPPPKAAKLPKGSETAYQALQELTSSGNRVSTATSVVPGGKRLVDVEQWRDRYYQRRGSTQDEPASTRRNEWNRAKRALIDSKRVGVWERDAWIW